jgi:S1-C subfamily serine protease
MRSTIAGAVACACAAGAAAQEPAPLRSGTGFAVSDATHIVTNAHVVEQCRSIRVLQGSRAEPARLMAVDAATDLAVLQANLAMPRLAVRSAPSVRLGESVVAFGFPLAGSLSMEGNLTTGNVSALAGLRDDPAYVQVTAPVQPGNSGGPLLDDAGNVIGVITAKLDAVSIAKRTGDIPQNVNFAVKADVLEGFLQRSGINYEKRVTDRRLAVADIADSAKAASVRIECSVGGAVTAQAPLRPSQAGPAPLPPSVTPVPAPVPSGAPAAISDASQRRLIDAVRITEVNSPYPNTSPGLRELTVANASAASLWKVTIGWMNREVPNCPYAASAYAGKRDVMLALKPGGAARTLATFPVDARAFCVIDVGVSPVPASQEALPPAPEPPSGSAAPLDSGPGPGSSEPAPRAP